MGEGKHGILVPNCVCEDVLFCANVDGEWMTFNYESLSLPMYSAADVTDIWWSYGENHIRLESGSSISHSFYVDLNLHVMTKHGGIVKGITIQRNDSKNLYDKEKIFCPSLKKCEDNLAIVVTYNNVLEHLKLNLNKANAPMTLVATHPDIDGKIAVVTVSKLRPRWKDVFDGYPRSGWGEKYNKKEKNWKKHENSTSDVKKIDEFATNVFKAILGEHHKDKYVNACATRVSIALLNGKVDVGAGYGYKDTITECTFADSNILLRAKELKDWLVKTWGQPDIEIYGCYTKGILNGGRIEKRTDFFKGAIRIVCNKETPVYIESIEKDYDDEIIAFVHKKINSTEMKQGVYIIVGGISGATGHATLWINEEVTAKNGGNSYSIRKGTTIPSSVGSESHAASTIRKGSTIYFWGLK